MMMIAAFRLRMFSLYSMVHVQIKRNFIQCLTQCPLQLSFPLTVSPAVEKNNYYTRETQYEHTMATPRQ